jgi:TRAP transporter 4TM/12TM fusion protein
LYQNLIEKNSMTNPQPSSVTQTASTPSSLTPESLDQLVKEADLGGREPIGAVGQAIALIAGAWSLFQIWYASPLPFVLKFGILNDTEARSIHLAFAVFLAFLVFPAFKRSSRKVVPWGDWLLALVGAFCAAYLFTFYSDLATRPGKPTPMDLWVGGVGILIMMEATRRAMGLGMLMTIGLFLLYIFAGPLMPDSLAHKGASLQRFISHMWLTTEGVYGVPLGVSVQFIFLFVLFGTLLDRAGAGNFMTQVSLAILGHLRGGPAKVAVVSSALNGVVSGSSVSNVVSGGIFTIPLMKRTGYSGVKAGAIEAASSINGQLMPPVMGAAAFLMVEYVGIPYSEIIKHAALPAIISYIALFYIVHLEALKYDLQVLKRNHERTAVQAVLAWALGITGTVAVLGVVYYAIVLIKSLFGDAALPVIIAVGLVVYLALLYVSSRYPDIAIDDPKQPVIRLPETWPTVRAGLHFLIPIVVLLWCLSVEELSPATSAFWGTISAAGLVFLNPAVLGFFRKTQGFGAGLMQGLNDLWQALVLGARNMIGVAVACASAGVIVGAVTLTGMGLMLTDFVEAVSAGNILLMLLLTAMICLLIGAGVPTTANYILVATLMAPVIVELGARSDLVIPLIGVHLFVFYFGIMADVTPPVGLASYAAAAISGDNPNATGVQATLYSLRTAVLPFVFLFNPALLMIGVSSWWQVIVVSVSATAASLLFAAATMGWFRIKCCWWEIAALLLATFLLFRPDWLIDRFYPERLKMPAADIYKFAEKLKKDELLIVQISGDNVDGKAIKKTVAIPMGEGSTGREKIKSSGVTLAELGGDLEIANVKFGSRAKKLGVEQGFKIESVSVDNPARPADYWSFIPAVLLAGLIWWLQGRRFDLKNNRR